MGWTDSAVRRYAHDAGDLLDDLNQLVRADCTTRNKQKALEVQDRVSELEARIELLREQEELAALRPALDGNQIMRFLGIDPGPDVGRALDFLMEIRLDEGEISEEEAYERLKAWAEEQAEA
jgi:poly(A) polymerase